MDVLQGNLGRKEALIASADFMEGAALRGPFLLCGSD
jgi:hypothetical protein